MGAPNQGASAQMRWVRPKWTRRQFVLEANGGAVATLAFGRGSQAAGQMAGEQYRFGRKGFFRPRIVVRTADGAGMLGLVAQRGSGGTLTLTDGRTFTWKKPKIWTNEHIWVDDMGNELARFHPSSWHSDVTVTVAPEALGQRDVPLLLLLGEYLGVLAAEDETAAIAATTTTAAGA